MMITYHIQYSMIHSTYVHCTAMLDNRQKHKPIVAGENADSLKVVQGAQTMTGMAYLHLAVTLSSKLGLKKTSKNKKEQQK